MSNRQALIAKIKEYKDQVENSQKKKEAQHLRFNDSVQPLYSQIESMLSEIDGVVTSTEAPDTFISNVDKPSLYIVILGRKVEFIPQEVNGVRGLRVMGLYDRDLFFRPLSSGTWEADDERSDNVIHFSAPILFERLIALVPSGPAAK